MGGRGVNVQYGRQRLSAQLMPADPALGAAQAPRLHDRIEAVDGHNQDGEEDQRRAESRLLTEYSTSASGRMITETASAIAKTMIPCTSQSAANAPPPTSTPDVWPARPRRDRHAERRDHAHPPERFDDVDHAEDDQHQLTEQIAIAGLRRSVRVRPGAVNLHDHGS